MDPRNESTAVAPRPRVGGVGRATIVFAVLLSLACLIQVNHRARKGRSAILKWAPAFEALEQGEPIYGVGDEGYPTLPLTLLVMSPFHALGETLGPLAWALFKIVLSWWIVVSALRLACAGPSAPRGSPWIALVVVLFSFRALYSDVQHGNLNVLVGATVVGAMVAWSRGRPFSTGLWIGLGTVLKVTPALGVVLLLSKRSGRGLLGLGAGLALFGFVVPGLWIGWARNLELVDEWTRQMVLPYFTGRELGVVQTVQLNQSLFGVLARLFTHSPAIEGPPPVYVNWLELGPSAFRATHLAASLLTLGWLVLCLRGRALHEGRVVLGEFTLLALAMLFLSERSWKHHYVLLCLPLAMLVPLVFDAAGSRRRIAAWGFGLSAVLHGASGEAVLGARGSDLAEAYGAWLWGGIALYIACGALLSLEKGGNAGLEQRVEDRPSGGPLSRDKCASG
ncbi:MAG: DUF2029 domain-containing protein [bacterium]|nr:DUF2029 domain-containing protein [bacterium]